MNIILPILLPAIWIFGLAFGHDSASTGWQQDCEMIGIHVSAGKVYKCEVKK